MVEKLQGVELAERAGPSTPHLCGQFGTARGTTLRSSRGHTNRTAKESCAGGLGWRVSQSASASAALPLATSGHGAQRTPAKLLANAPHVRWSRAPPPRGSPRDKLGDGLERHPHSDAQEPHASIAAACGHCSAAAIGARATNARATRTRPTTPADVPLAVPLAVRRALAADSRP